MESPDGASGPCAGGGRNKPVADALIYGLHAVAAALNYEPEQVRGLWVERQRRDGRIQALVDQASGQGVAVHLADRAELDRRKRERLETLARSAPCKPPNRRRE